MSKKKRDLLVKYKDSQLPGNQSNWLMVELGDICEFKRGPFGSAIKKSMFIPKGDSTFKVYEQGNAIRKNTEYGDYYISDEHYKKLQDFSVMEGDIIVSCAGTIGETYVIPKKYPLGVINQALLRIRLSKVILTKYFLLAFDFYIKEQAKKASQGTAIKNLPPITEMKSMKIGLPSLDEQKRIVDKIEILFAKIDEAKQLIEEAKDTFELRRAAILEKAINGELTEKWRNNYEGPSAYEHIKLEFEKLEKNYSDKMLKAKQMKSSKPKKSEIFNHYSLENKEVEGLKNWVETTFIHLCLFQRGYDLPTQNRIEGRYPIVSAGGVSGYHNEYKVESPGVTTGRSGTIGKVFYVEEDFWPLNTSLYVDYFNGNYPKYVYYYLQNFNFTKFSSSTAVPTLNRNNFFNEPVKIPPYEEQKKIVEILNNLLSREDELIKTLPIVLTELDNLKQSILSKAFKGELGTNDPSDEPAIELLKLILQEKL